jgi:hypothetical protein
MAPNIKRVDVPGGAQYALTPDQVESQLQTLRADPAKQVFTFTDKDGGTYKVRMVNYSKSIDVLRDQAKEAGTGVAAGETLYFNIGLAEV